MREDEGDMHVKDIKTRNLCTYESVKEPVEHHKRVSFINNNIFCLNQIYTKDVMIPSKMLSKFNHQLTF